MSKQSSSSGGIGFVGLLTIVFIVLKLTNYIDWSWWWVLSPIWIIIGLSLVILILALFLKQRSENKWKKFNQKSSFIERVEEAQRKQQEELERQRKKNNE